MAEADKPAMWASTSSSRVAGRLVLQSIWRSHLQKFAVTRVPPCLGEEQDACQAGHERHW